MIYALIQSEMEPQTSGPSVCDNAIFKMMCLVPAAGHHLSAGLDVIQGGDELKPVLSDETHDEQMNMSS